MLKTQNSNEIGRLLQEHRIRAGLTQEALAELAGLGRRSIQGLERGESAPRQETVQQLVRALALSPQERARFEATARPSPRSAAATTASSGTSATAPTAGERSRGLPLPAYLTSYVGREREIVEITRLLASSRLVTLSGPPGTGKTRLAVEVARRTVSDYAHGAFFVSLASVDDPDLVPSAVAQRLGIQEISGRSLLSRLMSYLQNKSILLVLDNFEQVVSAATFVNDLLLACSGLRIVVTSRTTLSLQGEQLFRVPPLGVPDPRDQGVSENLEQYAAVKLFLDRARAVSLDFAPTNADLRVVGEICRRLDGLPLAIELAAARSTVLSTSGILARLHHPLPLLTGGAHDLPARQQTLRLAIAWSYNLLTVTEQALFRRLAVFTGGWDTDAAAAVCTEEIYSSAQAASPNREDDSQAPQILDLMESLVTKSLVVAEVSAQSRMSYQPRFGMLETVREYAGERVRQCAEWDALRRRHAVYYLEIAEEIGPKVYGPDAPIWLDRLEQDHDNFRAALRWADELGEAEIRLRFGVSLYRFWWMHQHAEEGLQWLNRALATETGRRPDDDPRARLARAQALHAAAIVARSGLWDFVAAQALHEESLAILRVVGDRRSVANSLHNLASAVEGQRDFARAWSLFEESLLVWREVGERWGIVAVMKGMADLALDQGDFERARRLAEDYLPLARSDGFPMHIALALRQIGRAARQQGDSATARSRLMECLALFRGLSFRRGILWALKDLGGLALQLGDRDQAQPLLEEGLAISKEQGSQGMDGAATLELAAALAIADGNPVRAVRLYGAASALYRANGTSMGPADQADLDGSIDLARDRLGDEVVNTAWADGQAISVEQAIAYALDDDGD